MKNIHTCLTSEKGYTMAELMVSVSIISMLSVATFVSLSSSKRVAQLNVATQVIASDVRKMQSFSLSSKEYNEQRLVGGWGVYFNSTSGNNSSYILYADQTASHFRYNKVATDELFQQVDFEEKLHVEKIEINGVESDELHVLFQPPTPIIHICDEEPGNSCDATTTKITISNGEKERVVEINKYGLIDSLN